MIKYLDVIIKGDIKMNRKILEKLKDHNFLTRILSFRTKQEVINAFEDENISISQEEVEELGKLIINMIAKMSEMPEEELEKVSGGQYVWNDLFDLYHDNLGLSPDVSDGLVVGTLATVALGIGAGGYLGIKKLNESKWWTKDKK